jgi:hypothetical protein
LKITAFISSNAFLNDLEKLYYIRASLRDEAATLQFANDTYDSLWAALKQRYEIKRAIAERHINKLFALKSIYHKSSVQLRRLIDTVTKNIRELKLHQHSVQQIELTHQ